ncbi:DUF262 domain-containing protein [Prosthecobacter dejongeii]|uniref:GmrSD restriction endonucleases N-terminal domain-containing protein n=1 Tax=Prosthecobacter dejongeii TaxID=48465 RepID=A0A7W7YHD9_9BACT|nr:DUF262 domain-containing protein [Prosthecobacter dejongeii]MBB5036149.1 hypothetical protein [Prosthecobacter dejongeii]
MKFRQLQWSIKDLIENRGQIDPAPQYQRGSVWSDKKKQLLIDSILMGYDMPKFYLRRSQGSYDYEVFDGQQRMLAIFDFADGKIPLAKASDELADNAGAYFDDLPSALRRKFYVYNLTVSSCSSATNDEIRELFRRLQEGVRLTPPEIRNSMPSAIGDVIRSMALTHAFFKASCFTPERFQCDDLLTHAFAFADAGPSCDLKAPNLEVLYKKHARHCSSALIQSVNRTLSFMADIQKHQTKSINTKWGFVDVFGVLNKNPAHRMKADKVAMRYKTFESKRRTAMREGIERLNVSDDPIFDPSLYRYIERFRLSAGTMAAVRERHQILTKHLIS